MESQLQALVRMQLEHTELLQAAMTSQIDEVRRRVLLDVHRSCAAVQDQATEVHRIEMQLKSAKHESHEDMAARLSKGSLTQAAPIHDAIVEQERGSWDELGGD